MNWFLYLVKTDCPEEGVFVGQDGVGRTSLKPGVAEAPYGILLTVDDGYIRSCFPGECEPSARQVKEAILEFYYDS